MSNSYLAHHGTKGMKWGVRKYQNPDGSLTPEGRKRYGVGPERANQKYSKPRLYGMEAKYQVKKAGGAVKATAKDLSKQHRESVRAAKARRVRAKAERAERKAERQKEKEEALARKIAARESKKRLSDLKAEFDEARMSDARKRVAALLDKQDRIREKAFLKEQEKALKKEMKQLKKDAEKEARSSFSKKKIRSMTDAEIDERLARLKKEAQLVSAEADRKLPASVKSLKDAAISGLSEGAKQLARDAVSELGKKALKDLNITNDQKGQVQKLIDEYQNRLNLQKAKDALTDYNRDRAYKESTRDRDIADEELKRDAQRAQNMKNVQDFFDSERDRAYKDATRARDLRDQELQKAAQRAEARQRIVNATTPKKQSAEDATKEQARRITERKEDERRAAAYRKNDLTISEIAERMGISESKVKDLLYMK